MRVKEPLVSDTEVEVNASLSINSISQRGASTSMDMNESNKMVVQDVENDVEHANASASAHPAEAMAIEQGKDLAPDQEEEDADPYAGKWCGGFGDQQTAKGYNILGTARGPIAMSNVFLSSSFLFLASAAVGCVEPIEEGSDEMQVVEDCDQRVYGAFRPSSLITNIAVISGLMSAFFMPLAGAIIDYTPHRWTVGVVSATLITLIQIVQIGTTAQTWFPMAILQAITGFFYQVQMIATFAYMPEIRRAVSTETMTRFSSTFTMVQFGSQALFLIVIVGIGMAFQFDDIRTAQVSQAINSVNIIVSFTLAWRLMPKVPARHVLQPGQDRCILLQGFVQNWNTAKRIQRHYKRSIRWYLLGILFAEPAANAFTVVAVTFLSDKLGLSGTQIGIFFLTVLVCMVPGGLLSQSITHRTNPSISFRISMFLMFVMAVIGGFSLNKDNAVPFGYVWALFVGLALGSFYPSEKLYLSMICPKGIEAELAGFYVYCSQLLGWLPPLIFTVMVEANIDQKYGLIGVSGFFLIAIAMVSMSPSFDQVLAEVENGDAIDKTEREAGDSVEEGDVDVEGNVGSNNNKQRASATKGTTGSLDESE